jgi:hypothetical protein
MDGAPYARNLEYLRTGGRFVNVRAIAMKQLLPPIACALAIAIVVVLGFAAIKPATFRVERKTLITAPAAVIFPYLEDLHRWALWSPWENVDPGMQRRYAGAAHGPGAIYAWHGDKKVGAGRMTITDITPNERVALALEFLEPMASHSHVVYSLKPVGHDTEVSWEMDGPNNFVGKIISVFADMDGMIGDQFDTGLKNLKRVAEGGRASAP